MVCILPRTSGHVHYWKNKQDYNRLLLTNANPSQRNQRSSDDGLSSDGSGDEGDVPNGAAASEDEDEDVSASSDDEDMEE